MSSTNLKRGVAVLACAGAFVSAGATVAFAGEITGKGRTLEVVVPPDGGPSVIHGKSICAYSGLNDDWVNAQPEDRHLFAHVQTAAEADPGVVGYACNPTDARG